MTSGQHRLHKELHDILKKEERHKAYYLLDNGNDLLIAAGVKDLVEKLQELAREEIEVEVIYKERKSDATNEDVTEKYRKYFYKG